LILIT